MPRRAYRVRGHIWIEGADGTFLGLGRIILLERIRSLGSIRRAAASIRMSYRRAWELVESMNGQSASPLVVAATGGRGGGGASLTEAGDEAVTIFRRMDLEFMRFAEREGGRLRAFSKG
ncbi:MAG: LysR family transcriptional regulator [Deltaproteobacteria bacterium]|nr:LysR family transcriptional regulator [Deltaproteobacteria bacterium]